MRAEVFEEAFLLLEDFVLLGGKEGRGLLVLTLLFLVVSWGCLVSLVMFGRVFVGTFEVMF